MGIGFYYTAQCLEIIVFLKNTNAFVINKNVYETLGILSVFGVL